MNMSSPFAALQPLAIRLRQQQAIVHPASQVMLRLRGQDGADVFADARYTVLKWMESRAGRWLPPEAWQGLSFELEDVGSQRTAAIGISDPGYWAARLDDADRDVPQRVWTTEIGIGRDSDGSIIFGSRLLCVVRGEDAPFERSVPSFVRRIVQSCAAELDGRRVEAKPWIVETEGDVDDLVALLVKPGRRNDVIVFSLPEGSRDASETAVSAVEVASRTLGAAHVAIITGPASFFLSDRVGKEFSVFRQAVRTYRPMFDPEQDERFRHPLGLPERIAAWPNGGPEAYAKLLVSQALASSAARREGDQRVPSFASVRRVAAELRMASARQAGSSDAELLKLAEEEVASLRKSLEDERKTHDGLLLEADAERSRLTAEIEQVKAKNQHLRARLEDLEERLRPTAKKPVAPRIPSTLDGFEAWCSRNLSGTVDMHGRAFQGVKKSEYEDTALLYKSLLLLRDYYVPMKRKGGRDLQDAYKRECAKLGLDESATFAGGRAGEEGDTYVVRHVGQPRKLDRHLKKGNSREARYCFRLYFFWDDDEQQAVVGWLPSHLDTNFT